MKTKMLNLRWLLLVRTGALLLLLSVLRLGLITARADAVSELASFSIFDKVDLAQLAKSDVKTAHGPPMSNPRFLAVQSCYVVTGAPAQQVEALRRWDATRHRELNGLLREQGKIRDQFSSLLGATGIGRGAGSLKPELYWELLDVDDQGVVTLGASYNRGSAGGSYQAADILYYASGGYYVALTLYQMWPVTVEGKPSTLVWRGDMISAASLGSLHGVERLGSESVMMKNITKAVTLFRRDTGGGR